ncbi:MAG: ATP-binding protein [Gemmatimonadaceae bacterium]
MLDGIVRSLSDQVVVAEEFSSPPPLRPAIIARVCGWAAFACGFCVMIGWATDLRILRSVFPGMIAMLPISALIFMIAGTAVVAATASHIRIGRWWSGPAAILATVLGFTALAERLADTNLGIDSLLFIEKVREYPYLPPGRIAPNSAFAFSLLGMALVAMQIGRVAFVRVARVAASLSLAIAALAMVGYLYGAKQLYKFDAVGGMALITAIAFSFLSIGVLSLRPGEGAVALLSGSDLGGRLARRLLPWTIGVPILLGRLWIAVRDRGLVSREFAAAGFAIITMAILGTIVLRNALALRRVDLERRGALAREAAGRVRAEELQRAAEIANEVKVHLLATMSHELRTPLNAIGGYTQLMSMGMRGPITGEQRHDLDRIDASARYLSTIIGDILSFAKTDAGEVEFQLRHNDVNCLIDGLDALVGPQLAGRSVRFETHPSAAPITVVTDAERVRQILVNLVSNAVKFTQPGGLVAVSCVSTEGSARISVHDTGVGIGSEHLDRIFAPFVQIDRTLTGPNRGVGLGLSISRNLARRMGGDIDVASTPGKGSTFTLVLPLARGGSGLSSS